MQEPGEDDKDSRSDKSNDEDGGEIVNPNLKPSTLQTE